MCQNSQRHSDRIEDEGTLEMPHLQRFSFRRPTRLTLGPVAPARIDRVTEKLLEEPVALEPLEVEIKIALPGSFLVYHEPRLCGEDDLCGDGEVVGELVAEVDGLAGHDAVVDELGDAAVLEGEEGVLGEGPLEDESVGRVGGVLHDGDEGRALRDVEGTPRSQQILKRSNIVNQPGSSTFLDIAYRIFETKL